MPAAIFHKKSLAYGIRFCLHTKLAGKLDYAQAEAYDTTLLKFASIYIVTYSLLICSQILLPK